MLPAESEEKYIQILHNLIAINFYTYLPMKTKLFVPTTLNQGWKNLFLTIFVRRSFLDRLSFSKVGSVGVFYLLLTTYLFSQAPQGFNYQAVARDGDNSVLINTNLEVKIGLLQGSETGTLVWEEIHTVTTNDLGLFTLTIGDTTVDKSGGTAATFADIDWATGSYYMQVHVDDGTGYVDLGATEIKSVPYALYAETGDMQTLSIDGHELSISNGNMVTLPDSVIDDDADPANEIQDLQLSGNDLSITNNSSPTIIDLSTYLDNTDYWTKNGDSVYVTGANVGIGTTSPAGRLQVLGGTEDDEEPLFEVKNKDGQTVFAVYNNGVRVYVDDSGAKGLKGGFAVGGFGASKGEGDYMMISPDSVRFYIDTATTKGLKGGFAVGGFNSSKGIGNEYLRVTQDSVRIYLDTTKTKGLKGGFAVGGFSSSKGAPVEYLRVTADSSRIYVSDSTSGFSIASIESGTAESFLDMTTENYFIGHQSGQQLTTGLYNSTMGYKSGFSLTSGESNCFIGYLTGFSNTTGYKNVFLGSHAGNKNTNGIYNQFIGYKAGFANTSGGHNVFIGHQAGMSNSTAWTNTFIGGFSGMYTTTGTQNVFLGAGTGANNETGFNNVYIGYSSGNQNETGKRNVFIGYEAGRNEMGSDRLYIDNTETSYPLIWGDFSGNRIVINGNSANNPNNRTFYANGTAGGDYAWYNDSDERLKKNIVTIPDALEKVAGLRGVNFEWRDPANLENGKRMGFIAQEAVKVIPEVVGKNGGEFYDMQYAPVTALLVEAIKEQQQIIEKLQERIAALEEKQE